MSGYVLYGAKGCGSACVEAALELAGAEWRSIDASPFGDKADIERLRAVNPLLQVPALTLPDGTLMTESAAILIHLADSFPAAKLAPPPGSAERAIFLRWMLFLAANFYSTYAISDKPSRFLENADEHDNLKTGALRRRKYLWSLMDGQTAPAPFLAGEAMTLVDIYLAMMSWWTPGRDWFFANCPKLGEVVRRVEENAVVANVWARNFD